MGMTTRYGLHALSVFSDGDTETIIPGITGQSLNINPELSGDPTSGQVFNRWSSLTAQNPSAQFSTYAIHDVLDLIPLIGKPIVSAVNPGLEFMLQKEALGGTIASGSVHRSLIMQDGVIVLGSLNIPHQGDATISVNILPAAVGANDPFSITDTGVPQTIPADDARFSLGNVTIAGESLGQLQNVSIEFGVIAVPEATDSDVWPSWVTVTAAVPVITLSGIDPTWLSATGGLRVLFQGMAATQANTTIYLRKRLIGGTFVADGTAEHIKINAAGALSIEDGGSVEQGAAATASARLQTNHDGTNNPLVFDTTSTHV